MSVEPLEYCIAAFDLTRKRTLLYRSTPRVLTLHSLLDLALKRGARVISIRAIHPPPEAKEDT